MKKRVALCLEYPLLQLGGVEVLVRNLLEGLQKHYEIVLVSGDADKAALGPYASCIIKHIPWPAPPRYGVDSPRLAKQLRDAGVQMAHFHFGGVFSWGTRLPFRSPILACIRAGIPVMTTLHLVPPTFEGYCGPLKPFGFKLALWPGVWASRLQTLLKTCGEYAVSNHDANLIRRWYWPWRHRLSRIYHSQLREEAERPLDLLNREKVILCVGTIGPRKGQPILVRAFARIAQKHPDWRLAIVGRASSETDVAALRASITQADLGSRVEWTGPISDAAIVDWMYRASLFAMPSLQEGLGLSLQEALYRGCPAIGSRVGGIPELIDHERNGLLVEPGSDEALAKGLDRVLSDDAYRLKLASEARPSVLRKGMTREKMIERHCSLYDAILQD